MTNLRDDDGENTEIAKNVGINDPNSAFSWSTKNPSRLSSTNIHSSVVSPSNSGISVVLDPYDAGINSKSLDFILGFILVIGEICAIIFYSSLVYEFYFRWLNLILIGALLALDITLIIKWNKKKRRFLIIGFMVVAIIFYYFFSFLNH